MPLVKLETGYNIEVEFDILSFPRRFMAWLLDVLVCWLLTWTMSTLLNTVSFIVWTSSWDIRGVLASLPALFYHLVCEITLQGRTPGKMLMQCRVITEDGGQPGIGQYLIRWVFRLIDLPYWIPVAAALGVMPWWTAPLVLSGVVSIFLTRKSQRLGDIVAGTLLIDLRNRTSWEDTVFTELSDDYKPRYPQVMQLTDRDINTLKSIIETVRKNNNQQLARKIAERIISKTNMQTNQYPIEFLETLLLDYNYYATR